MAGGNQLSCVTLPVALLLARLLRSQLYGGERRRSAGSVRGNAAGGSRGHHGCAVARAPGGYGRTHESAANRIAEEEPVIHHAGISLRVAAAAQVAGFYCDSF